MHDKYYLTPVEFELMEILWELNEGSVHDVLAKLPTTRKLAYTSVSTMLRILQQKNILAAKKQGRQHIYRPVLTKQVFANYTIKKIVKSIFSGNAAELVNYLLDKNSLSENELNTIQQALNTKKKELSQTQNHR